MSGTLTARCVKIDHVHGAPRESAIGRFVSQSAYCCTAAAPGFAAKNENERGTACAGELTDALRNTCKTNAYTLTPLPELIMRE